MIEAQKAATEGAHVAVPEGLVPAMKMSMVIADAYSLPRPPHCYECFLHFKASRPHPLFDSLFLRQSLTV